MHTRALLAALFVAVTAQAALADGNRISMGNVYAFNAYNTSPANELVDVSPVSVPQSSVSVQAVLPRVHADTQIRPR